jgi:hypothetical protein
LDRTTKSGNSSPNRSRDGAFTGKRNIVVILNQKQLLDKRILKIQGMFHDISKSSSQLAGQKTFTLLPSISTWHFSCSLVDIRQDFVNYQQVSLPLV